MKQKKYHQRYKVGRFQPGEAAEIISFDIHFLFSLQVHGSKGQAKDKSADHEKKVHPMHSLQYHQFCIGRTQERTVIIFFVQVHYNGDPEYGHEPQSVHFGKVSGIRADPPEPFKKIPVYVSSFFQ
jgi:hypothetical protein